jgi:hypothetical protein
MLRLIYDETGHLGNIEYVGKGTLQLNFAPDGGLLGTKVVAAQQTIATGALEASVSELLSRWSELLAPAGFVLYSGSDAPQKAWNLAAPEQACGCVEY